MAYRQQASGSRSGYIEDRSSSPNLFGLQYSVSVQADSEPDATRLNDGRTAGSLDLGNLMQSDASCASVADERGSQSSNAEQQAVTPSTSFNGSWQGARSDSRCRSRFRRGKGCREGVRLTEGAATAGAGQPLSRDAVPEVLFEKQLQLLALGTVEAQPHLLEQGQCRGGSRRQAFAADVQHNVGGQLQDARRERGLYRASPSPSNVCLFCRMSLRVTYSELPPYLLKPA
ncbi:uncharacterized protein B0H64DRAFT_436429 [Chaetomium fimeti]|uniref:Uncharacterized protein n=1 Tax=Chaetomium fimeti TaxID=1854472 RepID=A0AAE0H6X2_9PEZI|nr:hypothetical protein B0H64DRAFT_436429 [Chaetomium fimeti]